MELAKDCLDVGLYTDNYDAMRAFYVDRLGLPYEELLKVGGGIHQHRLSLNGSVLKVNSSRQPLADAPTNYVGLDIGRPEVGPGTGSDARRLADPDGTPVTLVAGDGITVHWASSDPDRLRQLLINGFGAVESGAGMLTIGTTRIAVEPGGVQVRPLAARGFRYLTVQVRDVRKEHRHLLDHGWSEATAPVRLGDTAFISFVTDPDGARVEVSQRASLTGPLPDA
jgi:lactoylglutathione lyase